MGFGSLVTAIYSRDMIIEAALNASHGRFERDRDARKRD